MNTLLQRLMAGASDSPLSYDEARALARHDDAAVRRALAERTDMVPEILYYLAEDTDSQVRIAIADNTATPVQADLILSQDSDPDVRAALARKIATLAPDLSRSEQQRVCDLTRRALTKLAQDEIPRVRVILAEALKDIAEAPPDVINRLARDVEAAVAAPVLAFSPVLTDSDLLEIIRSQPGTDRLSAIAKRAGLKEPVTDAIAATQDVQAIADMLANHGAQIREETLDALIDRGQEVSRWHDPLVHRPDLHAEAARRLALFVADSLLEALMLRRDLTPAAVVAVAETVHHRLRRPSRGAGVDFGPDWREDLREAHALCRIRQASKGLKEKDIRASLNANEPYVTISQIALMADISPFAVAAAVDSGSPKAMVAMAWKAGLSPRIAQDLQRHLAHLPPNEILAPAPTGGFRLNTEEMLWQVEMFCRVEEIRGPR